MTFDDVKVIGLGSIGLLCLFLLVQAVFLSRTVDLWSVVRRYLVVRVVHHSQVVMSPELPQTSRQTQTDRQTDEASTPDPRIERLQLDRTKTALIEVLVYSGWDVSDIRSAVKGDNGAIGAEVDAARKRLGIPTPGPYRTPIVGRPTSARFETDPDYPYQAPA